MKIKQLITTGRQTQKLAGSDNRTLKFLLVCCWLLMLALPSRAATLVWDADSVTTGPQDGSGNWTNDTANTFWNGSVNVTWSDNNDVVFGAGTGSAGAYVVTNNLNLVTAVSVTFTNPGSYTITTNGGNIGQLTWSAAAGGVGGVITGLFVNTNVSAKIDVPWRNQNGSDVFVGSNSVLTFSQSQATSGNEGGSPVFKGAGSAFSTVNVTNGTWGNAANSGVPAITGTLGINGVTFNVTGTALVQPGTRVDLGRSGVAGSAGDAILNVSNGGQFVANAGGQAGYGSDVNGNLQISRGGPAIVNVSAGGNVSTYKHNTVDNGKIILLPDSTSQATLNVSGGVVNVGTGPNGTPGVSSSILNLITLMQGSGYSATSLAIFNLSSGIVTAKGLQIGSANTFGSNPTNQVNVTGGALYLDVPNITRPGNPGTQSRLNLSGGIIGATASWSPACTVPMNLTNINGDITFQSADANGTAFNISLSGALTGVGGLKKTGAGVLALGGANNYTGTTVVSNGTLAVSTANLPTNGPVLIEGAAVASGLPVSSVVVANVGQYWTSGNLTYNTGTPTADFNFGSFSPSATVAPVQIAGNLAFHVTPLVTISGSAIPTGTYPLWHYTGSLSGTPPTAAASLPAGVSGNIVNLPGSQTVALVVTASTYNPPISWRVGNGVWDINTTPNWSLAGSPVVYLEGKNVAFDDTASGTSPIAVTLNTVVNPANTIANNSTKDYSITGSGSIAGTAGLLKAGSGVLTLATTNTYTGGTTVSAGQLNINYGGDGVANSAIGTGPLTNAFGSKLDNTSGHAVTLLTPIAQFWNDDFTFVGTTNLNMGVGVVNLGSKTVQLTVSSNIFEVDGQITDNGLAYGLSKTGNGTLILSNYNSFSDGMQLVAGTLDINSDGAVGSGPFTITGGNFDNGSGAPLTLTSPSRITLNGSSTFIGSSDLDLGSAPISILTDGMILTVSSNTLSTEGQITGGNRNVVKNGAGTLTLGGPLGTANSGLGLVINAGTVNLNKDFLVTAINANAVTVNTNGTLVMLNPTGTQFGSLVSVNMGGGTWELNGDSEAFSAITFNSGVIRNGSFTPSVLTFTNNGNFVSLVGTNCQFDITNDTSSITIVGQITNSGSLVKIGPGLLTLVSNNTYTGSTIISAGTLALSDPLAPGTGNGGISGSSLIRIAAGATLDVSGRVNQTLTLNSGQTLVGNGSINGSLVASAGSTVSPGDSIGTLTVTNDITLSGIALFELNRTNAQTSDKLVSVLGTIAGGGGTLNVTNVGPAMQVGDTFHLFPSAVTGFATINLATTDGNGKAYTWNNNIGADGSISVASVTASINPNPGPIQFTVSGSTLTLSWPTNLGWLLQTQTNSLATGLGTNWAVVPGSSSVTSTNITINPANGSVFFRLVTP